VQLPAAQSAVHVAPSSQVIAQPPGPPQRIAHFDPALHTIEQPPARQLKLQSAPDSHVWPQPVAPVSQFAVHVLPF